MTNSDPSDPLGDVPKTGERQYRVIQTRRGARRQKVWTEEEKEKQREIARRVVRVGRKRYNWPLLKAKYMMAESDNLTEFAKAHEVNVRLLIARASREGWRDVWRQTREQAVFEAARAAIAKLRAQAEETVLRHYKDSTLLQEAVAAEIESRRIGGRLKPLPGDTTRWAATLESIQRMQRLSLGLAQTSSESNNTNRDARDIRITVVKSPEEPSPEDFEPGGKLYEDARAALAAAEMEAIAAERATVVAGEADAVLLGEGEPPIEGEGS